jgi:hypothetical protein
MTYVFKIKRTEGVGVRPNCNWVTYIGKSRIDGYPIFRVEYDDGPSIQYLIMDALIVNTKPGYTIQSHEIEFIRSLDDIMPVKSIAPELVSVQPMSAPIGKLFYFDYEYGFDERLLLMM